MQTMFQLIRKGFYLATIFVVLQLLFMLIIWILFGMNLFETSKSQVDITDLSRVGLKMMIALNQLFGLLLPALLYLLFVYGKNSSDFVKFKINERFEVSLLALGILILSFPSIQFLTQLNAQLPISEWMQNTSGEISEYMSEILIMENRQALIGNIFLIGLLPAIAEELFFRGVIQNELIKHLNNAHIAIWITSIFFSAFHFQFEGFLPRLFLGAVLGYAYFYSRSFFIPFLMHFTNNALLVVASYLKPESIDLDNPGALETNYPVLIGSLLIMIFLIIQINNRTKVKNEDPV